MCKVPVLGSRVQIKAQVELRAEHTALFSAKTNRLRPVLAVEAKAAKPTVDIAERKNK